MAPEEDGEDTQAAAARLLVVRHSRTGSTLALVDALLAGVEAGGEDQVERRVLGAFDAGVDDVLWATGIVLATPANFGYMSGALKDFLERIYDACLDRTVGRPWALVVKGSTDADGAVTSVERIVAGLRWRQVLPPLMVVGPVGEEQLRAAEELGATFAAGLAMGIF